MAKIRAFKGIRPKPEFAKKVAALPYDVYSIEEAREIIKNNEASFLGVDLPLAGLPKGTDPKSDEVYNEAVEKMELLKRNGFLTKDETPKLYIYELVKDSRSQKGLVCCASVDEYLEGTIKKHENTILEKESDRIRHIDALDAQTGPIFLVYKSRDKIKEIISKEIENSPIVDFQSEDEIFHRVWIIEDESNIQELIKEFEKIENLYIADGHHRTASAAEVAKMRRKAKPDYTGEEFNYFLSILYPMEETKIYDYNRVVKDLNGLTKEEFLEKLEENFKIEKALEFPYGPKEKGSFGLFLEEEWYQLIGKENFFEEDPVKSLDASLLQDLILEPILGIKDPRTSDRIDFVGGVRGLKELEKRCREDMKIAFSLYPTSIEELVEVADSGENMPPKSTWFEPKPRSGLFIHNLK